MTIVVYNGILAIFSLLAFYAIFGMIGYSGDVRYESILMLYAVIAVMQIILVVFIVPSLTAGSIAGEREKQTLEILLTTKLSSGQIVRGKLASSISDLILVVFSSIPVMAIVFSIGGVRVRDLCQLILLIVVTAVLAGSIGICMSARFKKTMLATIYTYAVILLFGIGYPILVGLLQNIVYMNEWKINLNFLTYIFLLHPGVTLGVMLSNQFGSTSYLLEIFERFDISNIWLAINWFWISIILQLAVSALFLLLAQKVLNPIKKPKKEKTAERAKHIEETDSIEKGTQM